MFRLDRVLYVVIPDALTEDGDPLDVLALVGEPSFTGCLIEVRPVGLLNMVDAQEHLEAHEEAT